MPRFVILEHDDPFPHLDFMLEHEGKLRTWRLLSEPTPGAVLQAEPLGDHRIEYLEFEGPLSGDRGRVRRVDAGTFEWIAKEVARVVVNLNGERFVGRIELRFAP